MIAMPGGARAEDNPLEDLPNPMQAMRLAQNGLRTMYLAADMNHDGLLSQREAVDANNLLVGGLFFQADKDGNGVVSQEEAREVQDSYLGQNPWAKYIVETIRAQQKNVKDSSQIDPIQGFWALLDANNDKQIQASEVRDLVQSTVQGVFASGDTNRDGKMSETEIYAAMAGAARAWSQFAFQQADTDNSGSLSREEFDKSIVEPTNLAFQILDLDHNGQITQQESQQTERTIISQLRMLRLPEPTNSPIRLIESGKTPEEAAQVPTFATPDPKQFRPQPAQRNQNPPARRTQER
jgi:Ca2+-binding EF-hand superfamily protein